MRVDIDSGEPVSYNPEVLPVSGLGDAPRTLVEELTRFRSGDVVLAIRRPDGPRPRTIRLRCVTTPAAGQEVLLNRLDLTLPQRLRRIDEAPTNLPVGTPM